MAQKAHDQTGADAVLGMRFHAGAVQAVDDGCHTHATVGVGLGVEENLADCYIIYSTLVNICFG